jgi:hypothetical protein
LTKFFDNGALAEVDKHNLHLSFSAGNGIMILKNEFVFS